jgi:predicted transcriptional regulator
MSEIAKNLTPSPVSNDCEQISSWKPEHGSKGTVIVEVRSLEQGLADFEHVWNTGKPDTQPRISFVSYDLMHKILAPNRVAVIQAMTGAGPISIREVARRVGRDFKGVHTDVTALIANGILERTEDGKVVFPYDNIRVEFDLPSAA